MEIKLDDLIEKHTACVNALDKSKHCGTCKHEAVCENETPCNQCLNTVLFMPVNPTKWEAKEPS